MTEHTSTQCLLLPEIFDRPVVAKSDQVQGSSDARAILLEAADRGVLKTPRIEFCLAEALADCGVASDCMVAPAASPSI